VPASPDATFTERLPAAPASIRRARHIIWQLLADWQAAVDEDAAGLLTSELVTNAIRHACTDVELLVSFDSILRVAVTDARPELDLDRTPDPISGYGVSGYAVSGRGLRLVDELATRWGIEHDTSSKTVWFELESKSQGVQGLPGAPNEPVT
jgi:anti-sigma regulatory factor (Ser/Thr protein kinase)